MKLQPSRVDAFLSRPPEDIRAALIYGPDRGLIRERSEALVAAVAGRPADPFQLAELTPDALKADPVRLADEAAALSFTGGRRLVRLRDATDAFAPILEDVLATGAATALVLVEAGELPPRSPLRRLFESARNAVALACYVDEAAGLGRLIEEVLGAHGLVADRHATDLLLASLGSDRGLSRSELEKLALYKGEPGKVGIDDVTAVVADSALLSLDIVAFAAASGDPGALDRALEAALAEGAAPVTILRAVARHVQRLLTANLLVARGRSPTDAMAALKPRVFFRNEDSFREQMRRWPVARLQQALARIVQTEMACKTTGAPQRLLCSRTLMQIAQAARAG